MPVGPVGCDRAESFSDLASTYLVTRNELRLCVLAYLFYLEAIEGSFARNGVSLAIVARRIYASDMLSRDSCDLEWLQT